MLREQKIHNSHTHHVHNNTRTLSPTKLLTPSAMSSAISKRCSASTSSHCSLHLPSFFFSVSVFSSGHSFTSCPGPSVLLLLFLLFFWAQFYVVSGTTSDDDWRRLTRDGRDEWWRTRTTDELLQDGQNCDDRTTGDDIGNWERRPRRTNPEVEIYKFPLPLPPML